MLLEADDEEAFKVWLVSKLETTSLGEPAVLAGYFVALITNDVPADSIVNICVERLVGLLHGDIRSGAARKFVDEIMQAIEDGSWKQSHRHNKYPTSSKHGKGRTSSTQRAGLPTATSVQVSVPSTAQSNSLPIDTPAFNMDTHDSKRATTSYEANIEESLESLHASLHRPSPQYALAKSTHPISARLGNTQDKNTLARKRSLEDEDNERERSVPPGFSQNESVGDRRRRKIMVRSNGVNLPGGTLGGTDIRGVSNMIGSHTTRPAKSLHMAHAFGTPVFSMAAGSGPVQHNLSAQFLTLHTAVHQQQSNPSKGRCHFYDTIGVCYLGASCSFDHSNVTQEEKYNPEQSLLRVQSMSSHTGGQGEASEMTRKNDDSAPLPRISSLLGNKYQEDEMDMQKIRDKIARDQQAFVERRELAAKLDWRYNQIGQQLAEKEKQLAVTRTEYEKLLQAKYRHPAPDYDANETDQMDQAAKWAVEENTMEEDLHYHEKVDTDLDVAEDFKWA